MAVRSAAFLSLALLAASPVQAADYRMEDLLDLNLAELASLRVVTAARTSQRWEEAQGSLWVVTEKEIRERGYRTLADVLRDIPGIDLQGPAATASRLTVRGVTGNAHMLVLQDGVRLGAPAGELVPVSINYPLYLARQVEVLLTPGSALYGADAVAGVVNIISRAPGDPGQGRIAVEAGGNRDRRAQLLVSGRVGARDLVFGAHREQVDYRELAEEYPDIFTLPDLRASDGTVVVPAADRVFRSEAEARSAWGRLAVSEALELGASYREVHYPTDFTTRPDQTNYGSAWGDRLLNVHGRWRQALSDRLDTDTLVSWSRYRLDPHSAFNNVFSNYQPGYKYAQSSKLALDSQWNYRLGADHRLSAGLVLEHLRALPRSADLSAPYAPDRTAYYPGTNDTLPVRLFHITQDNLGVFVQDQRHWARGLVTQAGLRFDDNSDYSSSLSPYLGLKYPLNARTDASLTYSQAFLAPSPSYSYEHFGSFTGQQDNQGRYLADTFRIPNPDLQPETARSLEAQLNWRPGSQWHAVANAYYSRLNHLILFAADTPTPVSDFIPGGFIRTTNQNVNLGESVATGLALSSMYRARTADCNWDLWGSYSFTEGHLQSPRGEEPLPYTARHKLTLGSTWRWPGGLFVSPTAYLMDRSRVPRSASNGSRSVEVPGYGLLNLYLGHDRLIAGMSLSMRVDNLTGRRYYHAGGSSKSSLVQLPQPGRSVALGAEVEF